MDTTEELGEKPEAEITIEPKEAAEESKDVKDETEGK